MYLCLTVVIVFNKIKKTLKSIIQKDINGNQLGQVNFWELNILYIFYFFNIIKRK